MDSNNQNPSNHKSEAKLVKDHLMEQAIIEPSSPSFIQVSTVELEDAKQGLPQQNELNPCE